MCGESAAKVRFIVTLLWYYCTLTLLLLPSIVCTVHTTVHKLLLLFFPTSEHRQPIKLERESWTEESEALILLHSCCCCFISHEMDVRNQIKISGLLIHYRTQKSNKLASVIVNVSSALDYHSLDHVQIVIYCLCHLHSLPAASSLNDSQRALCSCLSRSTREGEKAR